MELLDRLLQTLTRRRAARAADFATVVRMIADGQEPDPANVETILQVGGKSPADLQAAVEALSARRKLRAQLDTGPVAEGRAAAIRAALDRIREKQAEAAEKFDRQAEPLLDELADCQRAIRAAESARQQLRQTFTDPQLLARYDELRRRHNAADVEVTRVRQELAQATGTASERREARIREAEENRAAIIAEMDALDAQKLEV
jgi:chromosome segregation ATPase